MPDENCIKRLGLSSLNGATHALLFCTPSFIAEDDTGKGGDVLRVANDEGGSVGEGGGHQVLDVYDVRIAYG